MLDWWNASSHRLDSQKRAIYDRSGSDPESRYSGMPSSSQGSTVNPFAGASFDGELSPEDLFNMFFGAGGGGPFGPGFGGGGGPSKSRPMGSLIQPHVLPSGFYGYFRSWWVPHYADGWSGSCKECPGQ